jgi:hypothetical protein
VAVVLGIITLVLGSILVPLATELDQRQRMDTRATLDSILDALSGFAAEKGHLPCPDQTSGAGANDGVEDVNLATGDCTVVAGAAPNTFASGNLPWVTLGLGERDRWGNRYHYAVLDQFARRGPGTLPTLATHSTSGLRIYTTNITTCPNVTSLTQSVRAAAVILSHGKNGYGAMNAETGVTNTAPTSIDEVDNATADRDYVARVPSDSGSCLGEFDDIVTWMSRYALLHRMVAAGKLP